MIVVAPIQAHPMINHKNQAPFHPIVLQGLPGKPGFPGTPAQPVRHTQTHTGTKHTQSFSR